MRVFTRQVSARSAAVFGFETILICGSVMLAAQLHGALGLVAGAFWKVMLATALCELCFYYNDLYDLTRVHARDEMTVHVLRGTGAAALASAVLTVLLPSLLLGSGIFITTLGLLLIMIPVWRLAFLGLASDPHLENRILIVGTGRLAQTVARQIRTQHEFAYRIVGFIEDPAAVDKGAAAPVLGTPADLARLITHYRVNRVVVGLPDRRGHLPIQELLHAKLAGVCVEDAATTYERIAGKILVDDLKPSSLIFSDGFEASRLTRFGKRNVRRRVR
jgi:FlaA1/EpsC-like NDP-sugar epimerase